MLPEGAADGFRGKDSPERTGISTRPGRRLINMIPRFIEEKIIITGKYTRSPLSMGTTRNPGKK